MPRPRLSTLAAACATALATALLGPATSAQATTADHYSGTLADGATWIADKPVHWNGSLLLFSHGFGPTTAADAPSTAVRQALLNAGYALVGSSYDPNGSMWALDSAERDQFAALTAFRRQVGTPTRVISVGQSMGGLINAEIARDGAGRVDGSLGLCGLVAGGVDLDNYQLDAEYTLATFFDPADADKLVNLDSQADAGALAERLTKAVETAQQTPAGRARIALAAAYLNLADWAPGQQPPPRDDFAGQEEQQYAWLAQGLLGFIVPARWSVERSADGNTSWNKGVEYAGLLRKSAHAKQVEALYRDAGLDLRNDLNRLTRGADVTADPAAVAHLKRTSTAGQGLAVPLLDIHTTADQLVPVEQESAFAGRVRRAGDSALLRQAYVARQSHCNFTTAEVVAGLHAVEHRLDSGHWDGSATAAELQHSADGLGLDGAAFTDYRPSRLTGTR
ncbi:alpha/beta hydrolase [Streptomyces sp. NBC_00365]|uniref:alpha/beta hydrolase n=1 Tax=Streptomyces sp. NBC_00365 TaxID=2975726 RepID=UPI0022554270|nr:alpha/beta hydrolase [Streptomyces sp. NBC_00365]MCX5095915.1 alpha/beta hydrolase [Streptomyces sp. NBC_00365]